MQELNAQFANYFWKGWKSLISGHSKAFGLLPCERNHAALRRLLQSRSTVRRYYRMASQCPSNESSLAWFDIQATPFRVSRSVAPHARLQLVWERRLLVIAPPVMPKDRRKHRATSVDASVAEGWECVRVGRWKPIFNSNFAVGATRESWHVSPEIRKFLRHARDFVTFLVYA